MKKRMQTEDYNTSAAIREMLPERTKKAKRRICSADREPVLLPLRRFFAGKCIEIAIIWENSLGGVDHG